MAETMIKADRVVYIDYGRERINFFYYKLLCNGIYNFSMAYPKKNSLFKNPFVEFCNSFCELGILFRRTFLGAWIQFPAALVQWGKWRSFGHLVQGFAFNE
ncbi:hypothetical protein [Desulfosarcina ovata]|uniref:hypothetical protein n=1 Tax=Desulfosarcina ovata TaxID=83564 RepID=UPI0012D2CD8B|nr:hypothetical protein [Desulfosarcina ovata]